jgi:hypothetical protein
VMKTLRVLCTMVLVACGAESGGGAPAAPSVQEPSAPLDAGRGAPSVADAANKSDANPAIDAGPMNRAKCGAVPYTWLPTSGMGTILEEKSRVSYPQAVLTGVFLRAVTAGDFKTRRFPKHGTKTSVVRYQTQDKGKPTEATAMVTRPDSAGTFPILMVLHGTVGFNDACAPTGGVVDAQLGGITHETVVLASIFASFGYVVVVPDYLGLKSLGTPSSELHPYLVGEPTAIASLDAVRAARNWLAGTSTIAGDLVVVGGSQGGHAAGFVNRFQPHYAPEISIKGSVWDVPPSDLAAHSDRALATYVSATGNSVALFTTADSWYASAPGRLGEVLLPPLNTSIPNQMRTTCGLDLPPNSSLTTLFTPTLLMAARTPGLGGFAPWDCYLKENSLPTTSLPKLDDVPTLMLLGQNDTLVLPVIERASMAKLCSQGYRIAYLECAGASHTKPLLYALDEWFDFLEARLKGEPMPADTCTTKPAEKCTSQP